MAGEGPALVDRASFERLLRRHNALQRDFDTLLACLGFTRIAEFTLLEEYVSILELLCSHWQCTAAIMEFRYVQPVSSIRTMDCLHLEAQAWEALKPPSVAPSGSAAAVLGRDFYVCGGYRMSSTMAQRFRRAEQKWEVLASMSMHRFGPAAAVVGGRLVVCGGEDVEQELVHRSTEWFDASAPNPRSTGRPGVWRLLPTAMSIGRRYLAAAAVGVGDREELLVCGGTASPNRYDSDGAVVLDSAEAVAFALQEGPRRRHLPPMAGPRSSHAAARLRGRVFACGGESTPGRGGVAAVECFDPESESWATCAPMLRGRMLAAAAVLDGRLYVLGGCQRYDSRAVPDGECSVESFDPATESWEAASWQLPRGRFDFCAAAAWSGGLAV